MAQYDPQRSHTRHRKADDEGPAPVDALLGPDPSPEPSAPALPPTSVDDSSVPWIDPRPDLSSPSSATIRSATRVALAVLAVFGLLVLAWTAMRRRRGRPPQVD